MYYSVSVSVLRRSSCLMQSPSYLLLCLYPVQFEIPIPVSLNFGNSPLWIAYSAPVFLSYSNFKQFLLQIDLLVIFEHFLQYLGFEFAKLVNLIFGQKLILALQLFDQQILIKLTKVLLNSLCLLDRLFFNLPQFPISLQMLVLRQFLINLRKRFFRSYCCECRISSSVWYPWVVWVHVYL